MSERTPIKKLYSIFFKLDFPKDLVLVVLWLGASIASIYFSGLNENPVRIILTMPTIFFITGYCLIAALFPKNGDLSHIERIMLSIGFSIAIAPLIGFGLNFTPWGIQRDPFVISLILFTGAITLVAWYQRAILPAEERYRIPVHMIGVRIHQLFLPSGENKVDRFLSIVLTLIIIVVITTTAYVIFAPKEPGEHFTEFYILGENRIGDDYPNQIIVGENYPMFIGVGNQENRDMGYTLETWMVRTEFNNVTNTSHIIASEPYDHLSFTLNDNQTTIIPYNLSIKKTGYDRVEFLLFNESVPSLDVTGSDRINASYRDLHLWVTVKEVPQEHQYEDAIKQTIITS